MLHVQSLGVVGSAARGLVITGGTNATPIVATINAGHGLQVGQKIAITGVTGLTNMNGTWELSAVAATTVTLKGSVGNGTYGGTSATSVVCDETPFTPKHSVVVAIGDGTVTLAGTVVIKGSDDNVTFADVKKGVALAANPGSVKIEVELKKFMILEATAWTSGGARADMMSSS